MNALQYGVIVFLLGVIFIVPIALWFLARWGDGEE